MWRAFGAAYGAAYGAAIGAGIAAGIAASPAAAIAVAAAGLLAASALAAPTVQRIEIAGQALAATGDEVHPGVTVIRAADLARAGITTAEQALRRIVANQSGQGLSQGVGAFTGAIAEADLRGLGADKTLVLLNGRRLANHAYDASAVDLHAIPMAAVDRIEVLREGASAQHGSGAIAGVINFILRRDMAGVEATAQAEQAQGRGAASRRLSIVSGLGLADGAGWQALLALDLRQQQALAGADRAFASPGMPKARTRGTSFPGDLDGFEPSLAAGCAPLGSVPDAARGACRHDFMRDVDLIPRNRQATLLGQAHGVLGAGHSATLEALYAHNRTHNRDTATAATMLLPDSSPFWIAGRPSTVFEGVGSGGVVNWLIAPAGRRSHATQATTQRLLAALDGPLGAFNYRAALSHSRSAVRDRLVSGHLDAERVRQALLDGRLNPFGAQTADGQAALQASQLTGPLLQARGDVTSVDARVSRDWLPLAGGALAVSLGIEARREDFGYQLSPSAALLADPALEFASDVRGQRQVRAVLGELVAPLRPGLTLNLAARQEHASDSGRVRSLGAGLRWRPLRRLLLRLSASRDYRAATLYEVHAPLRLEQTGSDHDDPLLCPGGVAADGVAGALVCARTFGQRSGGPVAAGAAAASIRPESSRHAVLGLRFEPAWGWSVGIDLWRLQLRGVIDTLSDHAVFDDPLRHAGRIVRCSQLAAAQRERHGDCLNAAGADLIAYIDTPIQNLGGLKAQGLDLSLAWASGPTTRGQFGFTFEASRIARHDHQPEAGRPYVASVGRFAGDMPVLRWQHLAQGTWQRGGWELALSQRLKSGYRDQDGARRVGRDALVDASVVYTGMPNLSLGVGVNNLFNRAPPYTAQDATLQLNYDPRLADPVGRAVFLRVAHSWR